MMSSRNKALFRGIRFMQTIYVRHLFISTSAIGLNLTCASSYQTEMPMHAICAIFLTYNNIKFVLTPVPKKHPSYFASIFFWLF